MERSALDAFVSFSYEQERVEPEQRVKLNFANSPFTLYARTMEVLRFQNLLETQ